MNYLKFIFLLLFITSCNNDKIPYKKAELTQSKIDSLLYKVQVEDFVRKLKYPALKNYELNKSITKHNLLKEFKLKPINEFDRDSRFDIDSFTKIIADSLNISKSFYKADFDNNGLTDLLIIGDNQCVSGGNGSYDFSIFSFMNFGKDSIIPINLIKTEDYSSFVPKITNNRNEPILQIHLPGRYHWFDKFKISKDQRVELVYKFGTFIEFNASPKKYKIEKIELFNEHCHWKCSVFDLIINNEQHAIFNAKEGNAINENSHGPEYNSEDNIDIKGIFKATIKKKNYDQLINLLNYIDFPNMENSYSDGRMHSRNCTLKITYDSGKIKNIKDYGMSGTYGLRKAYDILFDLRFNQDWE